MAGPATTRRERVSDAPRRVKRWACQMSTRASPFPAASAARQSDGRARCGVLVFVAVVMNDEQHTLEAARERGVMDAASRKRTKKSVRALLVSVRYLLFCRFRLVAMVTSSKCLEAAPSHPLGPYLPLAIYLFRTRSSSVFAPWRPFLGPCVLVRLVRVSDNAARAPDALQSNNS